MANHNIQLILSIRMSHQGLLPTCLGRMNPLAPPIPDR